MKIVFIVSKFPCYDEAFILREIHALSQEMDVTIFSLKKSAENIIHGEAQALLPRVLYVPFLLSWKVLFAQVTTLVRHPRRYFSALAGLIRGNLRSPEFLVKSLAFFPKAVYLACWLKKNGVAHMHAYWATYPASVAMVARRIAGVPFSFTGHAHDIYLNTTYLKEKMIGATFVSTCTSQNKDHLQKVAPGYPDHRIQVIHHGLDLAKFEVPEKRRGKRFEILSVGTLHYYKGFQYLLPALGALRDRGMDFHGTIIGGGPLEEELKEHLRILNLGDHVTMTGPLKQEQVIPYYKKSDLLILMAQPEWHWGIPNVLIESLAARTAVITTRFGSVEELVRDGETGMIVPPKDVEKLADTIQRLAQDDAFRNRLAENGHRLVVEEFDLRKNLRLFREKFSGGRQPAVTA